MKVKKREFLKYSAGFAASAVGFPYVVGCKRSLKNEDSDLDFINMRGWRVDPHPNREPSVRQLNFLQNAKGSVDESTIKLLAAKAAALPDAYLQYLSEAYDQGFYVEVNSFGQGWAGLCQLGDPPGFVKIENSAVNSGHVFNHECGHALMQATFKGVGGSENSSGLLSKVYSSAQSSSEGSAAWSYSMKNYREYFACGVASYYASEACRADLQKNFSIAWDYFSKALAAPPTDKPFGSAEGVAPIDESDATAANQPANSDPSPTSSNLDQTIEQFMAFQMELYRQQMELYRRQMQPSGYSLTPSRSASIDNIQNGMEINAGEPEYIEIVPGFRDLTSLENYNVYLKDPKSKRHIELPSNFKLDVAYIKGGHAWTEIVIPEHAKIAQLVGNKFITDETGIPSSQLDIVVTDKNKNVIDSRRVLYAKDHADSSKELDRLRSPEAFAAVHKTKY